jgi:hypothetical protein
MRNFHIKASKDYCPVINLDKLWTLVSEQTREKYKNHPEGKAPIIDVVRAVSRRTSPNVLIASGKPCPTRCPLLILLLIGVLQGLG